MLEIKGLSLKDYFKQLKEIREKKGRKIMLETFCYDLLYNWTDFRKIERLKKFPPKVIENRILFETKNDFDGEGRIFYDYLIKNEYHKKYEIIWLVKSPEKCKEFKQENVRFIRSHRRYNQKYRKAASYKYMLTSRYIFYDQSVNWIAMTRKNQVFVDLWHGCEYALNAERKKIFFDYCLTPGEIFNLPMKEAFGCTLKKMLPLGYPHYDSILQGSEQALEYRKKLLEASGSEKLLLWYPGEMRTVCREELEKLDAACRQWKIQILICNTILETKLSEKEPNKEKSEKKLKLTNIKTFREEGLKTSKINIYELLHETDALISDYTSLMTDFLLLDRPMACILTELDAKRKWIFEGYPDFIPAQPVASVEEICAFTEAVGQGKDDYRLKRKETAENIFNRCDAYSSRIAARIFSESR